MAAPPALDQEEWAGTLADRLAAARLAVVAAIVLLVEPRKGEGGR